MRLRIGAVLAVGTVITGSLCGACEALSGLNNYSTGPDAADGTAPGLEAGGGDDTTSPPDDAPISFGEDASSSGGGPDSGNSRDALVGGPDSGHHDAGEPCGPSNCSTCCTDAGCASANANTACGTACTDCAASGKACSNGACVQTSCVAQSCAKCTTYFLQCCKASGGCGCSLLFPPGPCT